MTKSSAAFVYNVSMEVIYLDSLLAINFLTDYLICLVSAKICALPLKRSRFAVAAAVGALYSAVVILPGWGFLASGMCKLAFGVLMAAICFAGEAHFLRCSAVFFAVSAAFGGAAEVLTGSSADIKTFLVCFLLCFGVFSLIFRGRAALPDRKLCLAGLDFLGRHTEFYALADTGNALTDPQSGEKVMLLSLHAAEKLMPEYTGLLRRDSVHIVEYSARIPELRGKFRLIPCSTASGTALLPLFRPDKITLDGRTVTLLAAISPAMDGDEFEGIVPIL